MMQKILILSIIKKRWHPREDIWINPVDSGVVTSQNGTRINPITNKQENHKGIDIGVVENTLVKAVKSGTITSCGYSNSYGYYVGYKTYDGYDIFNAHLNRVVVKNGDVVSQGDTIAYSGSTGQSTGPHLHYEISYNNNLINPDNYISLNKNN